VVVIINTRPRNNLFEMNNDNIPKGIPISEVFCLEEQVVDIYDIKVAKENLLVKKKEDLNSYRDILFTLEKELKKLNKQKVKLFNELELVKKLDSKYNSLSFEKDWYYERNTYTDNI